MDLLVFFVARVPRRDLSLLWEIHIFNNFATLLIMALLLQVYILVVILTQM